ncbi:MAG: hypothetical protein R3333_07415, partial [Lishizhenia sp.]|nr:hypothetical protein [Lishizhenia sp.]
MKKISFLLMAMLLSIISIAQTNVGSGNSTGQALPIDPYYGYSYSQSVYLSSDINASGSITGVRYYVDAGTALDDDAYDWVVSIATSTRTSFSGISDWEPVANFTQVYADSAYVVADPAGDYVEILFNTPFVYNGTDNIIMAV